MNMNSVSLEYHEIQAISSFLKVLMIFVYSHGALAHLTGASRQKPMVTCSVLGKSPIRDLICLSATESLHSYPGIDLGYTHIYIVCRLLLSEYLSDTQYLKNESQEGIFTCEQVPQAAALLTLRIPS